MRANEEFSGRGHRDHVCKDCARERKAARRAPAKATEAGAPASASGDCEAEAGDAGPAC